MWSEDLSNTVSAIIRKCKDLMKFAVYMAFSFITFFWFRSLSLYMWLCVLCASV